MINKKKIHFYQLTFISIALVSIILLYNWGFNTVTSQSENMMSQSMGKMMSSMHLNNATISKLFKYEKEDNSKTNTNSNHHESNNSMIKSIHYITTVVIILLLPFIVAGTVFLAIIWLS